MRFEASHDFAFGVDALFDVYESEELDERVRTLSTSKRELLYEAREDGVWTRKWRITPARELPVMITKLLGDHVLSYIQYSMTDRTKRRVDWSIDVERSAGRVDIGGHLLVVPTDKGCRRTVHALVAVRLPVVGPRIEKHIVSDVKRTYVRSARLCEDLMVAAKDPS